MRRMYLIVTLLFRGAASQFVPDECSRYRCGDQCLRYSNVNCHCGNELFQVDSDQEYCCISSSDTCSLVESGRKDWAGRPVYDGFCGGGKVHPMSMHCNNTERRLQCHNSYQDSIEIDERAHYTCPHTCVSVRQEMCRGVNWCGTDYQECHEDLRCYKFDEKRILNSSLIPDHHYCVDEGDNDGIIDIMDRSDEDTYSISEGTSYEIKQSWFKYCEGDFDDSLGLDPGLMCGSECKGIANFCDRESSSWSCRNDDVSTSTQSTKLCGNPLVFSNVSCEKWCFPCLPARRCNGTFRQCIGPWYLSGGDYGFLPKTCEDKSDQIFTIGLTCEQHLEQIIELHDTTFCSEESELYWDELINRLICTNKTEWLSTQPKSFSDPHFCQQSCSDPSPSCQSCTNKDYFNCSISNRTCLHPDLECDGHPQCPDHEDEDLTRCHQKYIDNHIIEPYASYRCTNLFYDKMEIYAVPCNGVIECLDHSDELGCKDNYKANVVLIISSILILILVVVAQIRSVPSYLGRTVLFDVTRTQELLDKLNRNPDDEDTIQELQLHLYHTEHTQTVEVKEKVFVKVYDGLGAKHYDQAKLYHYLHTRFDPVLVQKMSDARFPGCTAGLINLIEEYFCRRPIVAEMTNFIARNEWVKRFLAVTSVIIKIQFKYLDIFKDLGLTIVMFELNGGINAILDLPTNFGSVIVMTMGLSILLPMVLSSIHLWVNNWNMLIDAKQSKVTKIRKYLINPFKIISFPFHPVFLENLYIKIEEQARLMAQKSDIRAVQLKNQCRKIRMQLASLFRIELGIKIIAINIY